MAELLGQIPNLPGARCKGLAVQFEATVGDHAKNTSRTELAAARAAALRTCAACPALPACHSWLAGLKVTHRPRGVVGGGEGGV
jgi:WhiB family transcriptional regulator, redox-sensing transcriptional regulator